METTPVTTDESKSKSDEVTRSEKDHVEIESETANEVESLEIQEIIEDTVSALPQGADQNSNAGNNPGASDKTAKGRSTSASSAQEEECAGEMNDEVAKEGNVEPSCSPETNEVCSELQELQKEDADLDRQCGDPNCVAVVSEDTAMSYDDVSAQTASGNVDADEHRQVEDPSEVPAGNQEPQLITEGASDSDPGGSRSMESLEDALQMAAASIEQQAEEGKRLKRKEACEKRRGKRSRKRRKPSEAPVEHVMQEQEVEEALAEHDPYMILDEVAPEELPKEFRKSTRRAGKKRSPKRKRTGTRRSSGPSPTLKRLKAVRKNSPDVEKRTRRSKSPKKESPKNKQKGNVGSLKVQLHGQVLNKRRRKPEEEAEIVIEAVSDHGSTVTDERDTPTPKILTAKRLIECRPEPNRLHVAATPGVYAIKKRGSWLMCGLCPFRSKQAADISLHLRQFDFYDTHCPKCRHVITKTHRGPDNKILSCLHCDYRNGDHLVIQHEQQTHLPLEPTTVFMGSAALPLPPPKEDIVAIAAKMILEDDDEEPQIISEITDESGQPVRVLSVERDLEELVRAGVVTLCKDGIHGNLAQMNITTETTDVVHVDTPTPHQTASAEPATAKDVAGKVANVSPKKVPSILRRRKNPPGKK